MSAIATIHPAANAVPERGDIIAALLYLAAANESERETLLSGQEQYGLAVILRWIASEIAAE